MDCAHLLHLLSPSWYMVSLCWATCARRSRSARGAVHSTNIQLTKTSSQRRRSFDITQDERTSNTFSAEEKGVRKIRTQNGRCLFISLANERKFCANSSLHLPCKLDSLGYTPADRPALESETSQKPLPTCATKPKPLPSA